jgi:hypothetical protein
MHISRTLQCIAHDAADEEDAAGNEEDDAKSDAAILPL